MNILADPLLVIIEYVPYGDLLGYLRKSRGLNDTYFKDPDVKPQTSLTSQQLIMFSWQVADGMRYLSSRNVSFFLSPTNSTFVLMCTVFWCVMGFTYVKDFFIKLIIFVRILRADLECTILSDAAFVTRGARVVETYFYRKFIYAMTDVC